MKRGPRHILTAALLLAALGTAAVHQSHVDAAQRRQQALNNALLAAIPNNHIAAVRDLLRRGADPNCQQQPASLRDRLEGNFYLVRRLDGATSQPLFMTALGLAVLNGEPKVVQALVDAGADVQQKDNYGETPLELAQTDDAEVYVVLRDAVAKHQRNYVLKDTAVERRR